MIKKGLVPALVVAVIVILTLIVFKPLLTNTFKIRKENQEEKKKLARLTDKAEKLEAIDEFEIQRRVKLVEEVFPSQKPVLNLLNSLEQLSGEEEVIFGGIELKPGEIEETVKETMQDFEISFSVEGNLANISSFISNLEKTPPLMKIETINLKLIGGDEKTSRLRISLGVRVFYQSLPETIGPIDQPLAMLSTEEVEVINKISSYRIFPKIKPTAPTGKRNPFSLL